MKHSILMLFIILFPALAFAQQETGPQISEFLWLAFIVLLPFILIFLNRFYERRKKHPPSKGKRVSFRERLKPKKLAISIDKDVLYNPNIITLKIENRGKKGSRHCPSHNDFP